MIIKLKNNVTYNVMSDGINQQRSALTLMLKAHDLAQLQADFENASATELIEVFEDGEKVMTDIVGYTSLNMIKVTKSYATVKLDKPSAITATIADVNKVADTTAEDIEVLSEAITELAEIIGG